MTYLHHVTLTTAHVRRSPRSEVADDVVRRLTPILRQALQGTRAAIWVPGYSITGGVHGRCMAVTLWGQGATEGPAPGLVPILTVGVASHSRCAAKLWTSLHEDAVTTLATDPDEVPPAPWCADRIEPGMALRPETGQWTGDFSRCVGWTWIEMRGGGS
jgi:hypothetical protein